MARFSKFRNLKNALKFKEWVLSGGLTLGWKIGLQENILERNNNLIHMEVFDEKKEDLSCSFVYGHLDVSKREEVWQLWKI